jgi:beta-N-acetylhexosaminidase
MGTPEDLHRLAAGTLLPGFAGTTLPPWIEQEYAAGLGAVCLYGTNVAGPEQLSSLTADLHDTCPGLVVALDEEGGDVTRLHYRTGSPEPGNALLGRLDRPELTRDSAARIGARLAPYGITLDLAPVVDVNSAPDNPVIGVRSFGADPDLVARHTVAWVEGLQGTGVAACAKHFPGHGDTVADSHLTLPVVDAPRDVLEVRELEPFRAAVAAGVASIMTSHIVVRAIDPDRPATFSPAVLGMLRRDLGFEGVIVSDALDMAGASGVTGVPEAAVQALIAGCDLLCLGADTTHDAYLEVVAAVVGAVAAGRLPRERLADAASRVRTLPTRVIPPSTASAPPPTRVIPSSTASTPTTAPTPTRVIPSSTAELGTTGSLEEGFEIGVAARAWLAAPEPAAIVQVDSETNQAVGEVPWGPATAGSTVSAETVRPGAKVAVVGRSLTVGHPAWALADRLRAAGHRVITVECGWPRGGADLTTFGASKAVGMALSALLLARAD